MPCPSSRQGLSFVFRHMALRRRFGLIDRGCLVTDCRVGFVLSQPDCRFDATVVPETGPFGTVGKYREGNTGHI